MIPKKPAPDAAGDAIRGGYRFPACAKPLARFIIGLELRRAKAGRKKIMLQEEVK
jgi:hypothetical protein